MNKIVFVILVVCIISVSEGLSKELPSQKGVGDIVDWCTKTTHCQPGYTCCERTHCCPDSMYCCWPPRCKPQCCRFPFFSPFERIPAMPASSVL
uniref:Cysteine rich secreted protein n=1 Tax=Riptortus pedestris TaxID=329032 RepID=R4WID9_RIPPE|nr:cysteine rich secreted protein [Riptortus pedestris]